MLNNISIKTNQILQNATESINDVSQSFTESRRSFYNGSARDDFSAGRIRDVGARYGAMAAMGERWVAKYVVGRGVKATDLLPLTRSTLIKQHGVVGLGLRMLVTKLGTLCGVSPESNVALRLADAAMAAVRFLVIGLPEAALVAFGFVLSAAVEVSYDAALAGVDVSKETIAAVKQARANRLGQATSKPSEAVGVAEAANLADEAYGLDAEDSQSVAWHRLSRNDGLTHLSR